VILLPVEEKEPGLIDTRNILYIINTLLIGQSEIG
jgi:hypothetical protein